MDASEQVIARAAGPRMTVERIDSPEARRAELLDGLMQPQAMIPPKYFYDERGSALYERIVALDEYYLPRTEAAIFEAERAAIAAALPSPCQWIYLGCGDGVKAWPWIEALNLRRYIGVDIAQSWLRESLVRAQRRFPDVEFDGVVTDFTRGLALQSVLARREALAPVFFYPGSSIGNFDPPQAVELLRAIAAHLGEDGRLLIAVDGLKDEATIVAAYDDAPGVTAAFNRNVLAVVNRELGAGFDVDAFDHRAVFNRAASRIEMHLVARYAQHVRLGGELERPFERGETIVTEYSYKYAREHFESLLVEAGLTTVQRFGRDAGYHVFVAGR